MKILVLNSGSSSVKFQLIEMKGEKVLAKGVVEKIGSSDAIITYRPESHNTIHEIREVLNHDSAISIVLSMLLHPQYGVIKDKNEIGGIGHRIVHGGEDFTGSVRISDRVRESVRRCIQFAPLHNPHNLKGIEACEHLLSGIPQVGVFDTAFHHTIPPKAFVYGLPFALYKKLGIRRYGFHGTSHRYVAARAVEILAKKPESLRLITCHLGNGASVTAVDGGKSVDTSMGFTPLEGLIMGTRCGDIDPALVPYIMERENLTTKQIDGIMNKNSGMLGLTETSHDMREIEAEAFRGSEQHRLALDIYCYRLRKYIGAYMAVLGKVDAIVMTGGIGEKSFFVRENTLSGLEHLEISIDPEKNRRNEVSIGTGNVQILVIPTNEELAIARDTVEILEGAEETEPLPQGRETVVAGTGLTREEKASLLLIWAEDPDISMGRLAGRLKKKTGKAVDAEVVERELGRLGLLKNTKKNIPKVLKK